MSQIQRQKLNKRIFATLRSLCMVCIICTIFGGFVAVPANAAGNVQIDYINESIELRSARRTDTPVYMYSPNASITSDAKKQAKEKWFPIVGNTLNISKYIPSKPGKESVIAIRLSDDVQMEDGTYESREAFIIPSRPNISASDLKRQVIYDAEIQRIRLTGDFVGQDYDYQLKGNDWYYKMRGELDVSPKYMPLGGVVTIRLSADESKKTFASVSIKIKIQKPMPAPNAKVNLKRSQITGVSNKCAWSFREYGEYTVFEKKTMEFEELAAELGEIAKNKLNGDKFYKLDEFESVIVDEVEYIKLYVKVMATVKKPASAVRMLLIPLDEINRTKK